MGDWTKNVVKILEGPIVYLWFFITDDNKYNILTFLACLTSIVYYLFCHLRTALFGQRISAFFCFVGFIFY